jgi:hypothetical protein
MNGYVVKNMDDWRKEMNNTKKRTSTRKRTIMNTREGGVRIIKRR